MISICIPTYNRINDLKHCMNSIFSGFENYPCEVIVADGGSTDGSLEYLRSLDNITLIEQGKLTGAIKAINECFRKAKGDYVFSGNDDFEIMPDVIEKCCKLMDKEEDIAMISPKLKEPYYGNLPGITVKKYWILLSKFAVFRHSVLKKVNYFDENFRTYYVDDDSYLSIMKLGYTTLFTKEFGIIHHRTRDEQTNVARLKGIKEAKKEVLYLKKKWKPLEENIEEYLKNAHLTKYRSDIYTYLCNRIYESEFWRNNIPTWLYDYLVERVIVFKDKKYDKLKDFYLPQKYPKEILENI